MGFAPSMSSMVSLKSSWWSFSSLHDCSSWNNSFCSRRYRSPFFSWMYAAQGINLFCTCGFPLGGEWVREAVPHCLGKKLSCFSTCKPCPSTIRENRHYFTYFFLILLMCSLIAFLFIPSSCATSARFRPLPKSATIFFSLPLHP